MRQNTAVIRNRILQKPIFGAIVVFGVFGLGYLKVRADIDPVPIPGPPRTTLEHRREVRVPLMEKPKIQEVKAELAKAKRQLENEK